jgi:type I restriction enzyme S subunit
MKHNMPAHWELKRLRDVSEVVTGTTPSTSNQEYYGGLTPFVTPAELDRDALVVSASNSLSELGCSQVRLIPAESVMVCCIGSLGKVGFAGMQLATNQQINSVIFDKGKVLPRYGFHYCKTLKPLLVKLAPSTTVPIINKGRFQELEIPLPPLDEQRRIAAILDKADAIRRKRQESIRLTEEFLRATFLEMFGNPVTNPKGWEVARLEDISDIQSGITKGRKLNGQETISVPYMRVANVQDGHISLVEIKEIEATPDEIERYRLYSGDILLTEGGDPDKLGRGAVWQGEITPCIHQNHIFRVRPNLDIALPAFLSTLIGSARGKQYFLGAAKQTTGIASINKTQLSNFPALLPPIELQLEYTEIVCKKDMLQQKIAHISALQGTCFNSLTHRAFRGEL